MDVAGAWLGNGYLFEVGRAGLAVELTAVACAVVSFALGLPPHHDRLRRQVGAHSYPPLQCRSHPSLTERPP